MEMFQRFVGVGQMLAGTAPFFRVLFPLLWLGGTGIFGVLGVMGVVRGRTIVLARRGRSGPVEGVPARVVGVVYVGLAAMIFALLAPVVAGLVMGPA